MKKRERLLTPKVCTECGASYRPYNSKSVVCSTRCMGTRRKRLYPMNLATAAATAANKARHQARLLEMVKGLTPVEAFNRGYRMAYNSTYKRYWLGRAS